MNKRELVKFINKIIIKESIDLNNRNDIIKWLELGNGPDSIYDDQEGTIDWNYTDPQTGDSLDELINTYLEKYNEIKSETVIELFRAVRLKSINDLNLNNIGSFWSFNESGAYDYGTKMEKQSGKLFTLTAKINTNDINWEQSFYSFLSYGRTEFECFVNKRSKCVIIAINDKILNKPINGII